MNISYNMALSMAAPPKSPATSPLTKTLGRSTENTESGSSNSFSLYKGISDRPIGWKQHRRSVRNPDLGSASRDMSVRRWDGAARQSIEWDGLRRDTELWYPQGNCLVHLYEKGQSRRGPAFRVPMDGLVATNCQPLLDRFLVKNLVESPYSDVDSFEESCFGKTTPRMYELYIPAPASHERGEAFLYHTATRNFFAWIFGKSLVGNHLGGALVGLLNSMSQFRSAGEDNVQAIMDYMDEEGYADMRNQPDYALAILFFAEHFHFRDLWIDAFAHCVGMNEKLITSPGFEFMSRTSRALVTRSRFEMDMRLDRCGRRLSSFLSDDLSETHLGLSPSQRVHLDRFRTFLQSYYVAKLGYYPPAPTDAQSATFPKNIYGQMCQEFQKLYDYLVDSHFNASDPLPTSHLGGICVQQSLEAFEQRHKHTPLSHRLPLLPDPEEEKTSQRPSLSRRLSFIPRKADKMQPDPRLVTFASLTKAANRNESLFECTLVRAYRGFEKECVFSPSKTDKSDKLSQADARKIRWILIYATLQTLLSATQVPQEVRDTQNVSYNISVLTTGPPWKEARPLETLLRTQTDQTKEEFIGSLAPKEEVPIEAVVNEIKPDIDYVAISRETKYKRDTSDSSLVSIISPKSTVQRALRTLGNMPELVHPRPQRASYHEILVHGYGNGTNAVSIIAAPAPAEESPRKSSSDSGASTEDLSSRWSHTSGEDMDSPASSAIGSRRGSDVDMAKKPIKEFLDSSTVTECLDEPMSALSFGSGLERAYSASIYDNDSIMQPDPLPLKRASIADDQCMRITTEVKVEWDESGEGNNELLEYLEA